MRIITKQKVEMIFFLFGAFWIRMIVIIPHLVLMKEMNKLHCIDVSQLLSNTRVNINFYLFVAISNRMRVCLDGDPLMAYAHLT